MWGFIKKKIQKRKIKNTFQEYGYKIDRFNLPTDGMLEFAQWLHPFDKPKIIEQQNVDFYRSFLNKGDFAIDIGAHTGDTTVPMALATGKEGKVLAFEPNQYVYKILEANSKLNGGKTQIIPVNYAVTEEEGTFAFHYSDASFCNGGFLSQIKNNRHNHKYTLEVEGKNLEKFLLEKFSEDLPKLRFIKIDAEGYDKEIVRGIKGILEKYKPIVVTECYKRLTKEERSDFFTTIRSINYTPFHLNADSDSLETQIYTEDDMMKWKHFDMILKPRN